jgi:hypothetical protein
MLCSPGTDVVLIMITAQLTDWLAHVPVEGEPMRISAWMKTSSHEIIPTVLAKNFQT